MKLMRICTTMMTIAPGEVRENASLFLQYKTLQKFGSRHLLQVSSLSLSLAVTLSRGLNMNFAD
jgi:hypothetical protein